MDKIKVMSENKQLSPEEVKSIKDLQTKYNKTILELGSIESQIISLNKQIKMFEEEKSNTVSDLDKISEIEKELITALQEKYGTGNINIETGEIIPL
jgi:iron only hydrogenase large subunit-like protein